MAPVLFNIFENVLVLAITVTGPIHVCNTWRVDTFNKSCIYVERLISMHFNKAYVNEYYVHYLHIE